GRPPRPSPEHSFGRIGPATTAQRASWFSSFVSSCHKSILNACWRRRQPVIVVTPRHFIRLSVVAHAPLGLGRELSARPRIISFNPALSEGSPMTVRRCCVLIGILGLVASAFPVDIANPAAPAFDPATGPLTLPTDSRAQQLVEGARDRVAEAEKLG